MYINYEKLRQALAKTMVETCASEDSLFALCYDVFSGGASTFSSRNPWKGSSYASRQLPPRTYYFNYDRNLVNELFNSYTFSGYSYDASTDTNFDEIYYYNPYLNMLRLFDKMGYLIDITTEKPHENIDSSPFNEQRTRREEQLYFDDNDAKQKQQVNETMINDIGDSGGMVLYDIYGLSEWNITMPTYYATNTMGYVTPPPRDYQSDHSSRGNTLNANTPKNT